jgi:signal peptidase I
VTPPEEPVSVVTPEAERPDQAEADGAVDATAATTVVKKRKRKRSTTRSIVEWVAVVGGALVVALIIRTFFLAAFYIPSESMVPTLQKGDRVLVNKLSYKLHPVHRGDVVVFGRPPAEQDVTIKDLIKRVIGLPGETVEVKDCHVFIDGRQLVEPYVKSWTRTCTFPAYTVPKDAVFVMGDNRDDSQDSRFFKAIPESLIVGRAFVVVWPLTHLGWL